MFIISWLSNIIVNNALYICTCICTCVRISHLQKLTMTWHCNICKIYFRHPLRKPFLCVCVCVCVGAILNILLPNSSEKILELHIQERVKENVWSSSTIKAICNCVQQILLVSKKHSELGRNVQILILYFARILKLSLFCAFCLCGCFLPIN